MSRSTHRRPTTIANRTEKLTRLYELRNRANGTVSTAKQKYELGMFLLAHCQGMEDCPEKEVFESFLKASQGNHAEAYAELSMCYLKGFGVRMDQKTGLRWFRKAFDASSFKDLHILHLLEHITEPSEGSLELDVFSAVLNAWSDGHEPASLPLAMCYFKGFGVSKDHASAK